MVRMRSVFDHLDQARTTINKFIQGGTAMRRLLMIILFLVLFLLWNNPLASAQFSEAGVEKLRVAVDAPD